MGKINWVMILIVTVLVLAGWIAFYFAFKQKTGFILNQRVFTEFKGTKLLESKIKMQKEQDQKQLDSLYQIFLQNSSQEVFKKYQQIKEDVILQEQQMTDQYTAEIWSRINKSVSAYGKEQGYDFILGASGDGSLMYAKESVDITQEVISYINSKYDGK